jgi:F-type H+-transporting ATPase subunit gamma
MSRLHEIRSHIAGVTSTKKITRAMYLISASKSQKARAQLEKTLPYFNLVLHTLSEILSFAGKIDTPYIGENAAAKGKGNLYLVLGGDKGMAGGYNHNLINLLHEHVDKASATMLVAGILGRGLVERSGYKVDLSFRCPVMNPTLYRAGEVADLLIEKYNSQEYREIYIVYTEMITPLKQEPVIARLLPLHPEEFHKTADELHGHLAFSPYDSIMYEPSAHDVFDHLVPHYLKGIIYAAFVEAFTSEQQARMYAMDNATKSATDMIGRLSLVHNRARQAVITQEISEIVGGIPTE